MKQCTKCKTTKALSEFYKDKRTNDGRKSECKACFKSVLKKTRDPEKRREHNRIADARRRERDYNKVQARESLRNAVRDGRVIKPKTCDRCNKRRRLHGHHHDYSKPLDVEWLCEGCHVEEHHG